MVSIRQILLKIFPKLRAIEENPDVQIIRISQGTTSNPFSTALNEKYDEVLDNVPCIYSEQPEIATSNNNITTQQTIYLYIKSADVGGMSPGYLSMKDRFVFKNKRYKPADVQDLFGLWKVRVVKE